MDIFLAFYTLLSQWEFFPCMGNLGRFPQGKPAATESRTTQTLSDYKVHARSFPVPKDAERHWDVNPILFIMFPYLFTEL